MSVFSRVAPVLLALALAGPASAQADWEELGGALNADSSQGAAQEMVGVGGTPWIAHTEQSPGLGLQLYVSTWNGTTWTRKGGALNLASDRAAITPSIANVGGVPYVAWTDVTQAGAYHVRVARWDEANGEWDAVGDALNLGTNSAGFNPTIRSIDGEPYVGFSNTTEPGPADGTNHVVRWDEGDSLWHPVGGAVGEADGLGGVSITDAGGVPYVAWPQLETDPGTGFVFSVLHVARFNGTAWVEVGSPASPEATDGFLPSMAEVDGRPAVAWIEQDNPDFFKVRVSRLNEGDAWASIGAPVDPNLAPGDPGAPSLLEIGGDPYVAWGDGPYFEPYAPEPLRVVKWNGSAWSPVGSGLRRGSPDRLAHLPSLASVAGQPHVAYTEAPDPRVFGPGAHHLYAARFEAPPPASFRFASATPSVNEASGSATITVERTGGLGPATVSFATSNGTADAGSDYTATSGTLSFGQGQTSRTFTVPITDDGGVEGDETVNLTLSAPSAGAELGTPSTGTLTIVDDDTIDTQIVGGPTGPTNDPTAGFAFTATPSAGASFECSLDGAAFTSCPAGYTTPSLPDGPHELRVRAKNATDTDGTPAHRNFFVDTVAPTSNPILIPNGGSQLPGDSRYSGSVVAAANGTDPNPQSEVAITRCVLDPPSPPTQFIEMPQCSAKTVSAPGEHVLYAASQDRAGNVEPVVKVRRFTIVPQPDTTITSGPNGVSVSLPSFTFTSSIPGSRFECRVDGAPFAPCSSSSLSPFRPSGLALGDHTLFVLLDQPRGPRRFDPRLTRVHPRPAESQRRMRLQLPLQGHREILRSEASGVPARLGLHQGR